MSDQPNVVVLGSANLDIVVPVPHHPATGETVLGGHHDRIPGGKGANQAVAAARLGARVAMVGRVGSDDAGRTLRTALQEAGVDCRHLAVDGQAASGLALIGVDRSGDNTIIVSPGANHRVGPDDVAAAAPLLASAAVTLVQLEVPAMAVEAAVAASGGKVVLNPAPASLLSGALLERVDVLVPNRIELAQLAGSAEAGGLAAVEEMARGLPVPTVVVTLGADGALLVAGGDAVVLPAPPVEAVDTTGAGDAFCGAIAEALARGVAIDEATARAVHAGSLATTRRGAQPSLPTGAQVNASLARL
jgi:ribokinase